MDTRLSEILERLQALGASTYGVEAQDWVSDDLVERNEVDDWFAQNGNIVFAPPDVQLPRIMPHPGVAMPTGARIVVGGDCNIGSIMVWGEGAKVILAANQNLARSNFYCGSGGLIYCGPRMSVAGPAEINARNGGMILVAGDGLWSNNVKMMSDDMHAIRDIETGARVNKFGGTIVIERHVWIGYDVLMLAGAAVGKNSVVGARSIVTTHLPASTVSVGFPARPVREGITWTMEDEP